MQQSLRMMFLGAAMLVSVAVSAQERAATKQAGVANPLMAAASAPARIAAAELPDAPAPRIELQSPQSSSQQQQPAQPDSGAGGQQQKDLQKQQVKKQEHQRAFGIVPSFNTSMDDQAVVLTGMQKINIAVHTSLDPFTFAEAFVIGGYHELGDKDAGFGWGAQGYFKRVGAAYADTFDGNVIGNGILPAVLHQDPRFFRLGHGSILKRGLYVAATAFVCKGDRSRRWQPNVSNVGGNMIAGYISTFYYPRSKSGWGQTIGDGMMNTFVGIGGTMFQEFWPDVAQRAVKKHNAQNSDE